MATWQYGRVLVRVAGSAPEYEPYPIGGPFGQPAVLLVCHVAAARCSGNTAGGAWPLPPRPNAPPWSSAAPWTPPDADVTHHQARGRTKPTHRLTDGHSRCGLLCGEQRG